MQNANPIKESKKRKRRLGKCPKLVAGQRVRGWKKKRKKFDWEKKAKKSSQKKGKKGKGNMNRLIYKKGTKVERSKRFYKEVKSKEKEKKNQKKKKHEKTC